ncbi:hypothetical protein AL544_009480 [Vibrio mimicus]|uniref:Uncharacterized protein n=1 Tax=Vibrio mimicus TaxID=674 RepID=A0A2J9UXP6_VIBMI|nr:hypothetical protein AL544_009480 [Vibrio mimicus]TXY27828.1 hypothetical protein FXE86_20265 [Vibrio mimicus]
MTHPISASASNTISDYHQVNSSKIEKPRTICNSTGISCGLAILCGNTKRREKKYRGIAGGTIPRVSTTPSLAAGVI